jgi:hypothetical protein
MAGKTQRSGGQWFPVSAAAAFIGVSAPNFRMTLLPRLSPDDVQRDSKPMLVRGPAVVAAIAEKRLEQSGTSNGTSSEALEEIRRWEARRRELRYRRESAEYVPMSDVEGLFSVTGEIMRRAGETIRQEFGDRAAKILGDAWGDVDAQIDVMFADGGNRDD